jgi:glycine/D-amino acid oxidase-like deaminating enzyme/nitrite reductase/ring-hydroxylating ferredoxin subunit
MSDELGQGVREDRVSLWVATCEGPKLAPLQANAEAEVVVIGAGILGLTVALLLCEEGRDVLVLERGRTARGVSGYTTAKLTGGHGLIYSELESTFNEQTARLYADAQTTAIDRVRRTCDEAGIECDLERLPNYVYAETAEQRDALEAEAAAARRAGLAVELEDDPPASLATQGALRLDDQFQFHVRKYLVGLADRVSSRGGRVAELTAVREIEGDGPYVVHTDGARVSTGTVVAATHYPIVEQGFFATRIHPRRGYVVAAPLRDPEAVGGMFINTGSPTRSVRTARDGEQCFVLVGGEGHPTGEDAAKDERYAALESFLQEQFDAGDVAYRWSTQDTFSVDGLPYAGRVGESGSMYTATGFRGWGMSNGTACAQLISDLIQGRENPWTGLFSLDRSSLLASAKAFVTENVRIAAEQLLPGKGGNERAPGSIDGLQPGEATVLTMDGRPVGVSRSLGGELRAVSTACTHMGCTLAWNMAESSWDCPCHGSRFAADGALLHGPALQDLKRVDLDTRDEGPP